MNARLKPSISVVIPSWNGKILLEEMFPALLAATHEFHQKTGGSWEVIVVDDGSVDDTIPWIEKYPEKNIKLRHPQPKQRFCIRLQLGFFCMSLPDRDLAKQRCPCR